MPIKEFMCWHALPLSDFTMKHFSVMDAVDVPPCSCALKVSHWSYLWLSAWRLSLVLGEALPLLFRARLRCQRVHSLEQLSVNKEEQMVELWQTLCLRWDGSGKCSTPPPRGPRRDWAPSANGGALLTSVPRIWLSSHPCIPAPLLAAVTTRISYLHSNPTFRVYCRGNPKESDSIWQIRKQRHNRLNNVFKSSLQ